MSERRPVPKLRPRPSPPKLEHHTPAETPSFADMLKDALNG